MKNAVRLSEKWFRRGLWVVAVLFAWFLIGLGSVIVEDLPKVEAVLKVEDFIDQHKSESINKELESVQSLKDDAKNAVTKAENLYRLAQNDYVAKKQIFDNWLKTREVTGLKEQDKDLIARTEELEHSKQIENKARANLDKKLKSLQEIDFQADKLRERLNQLNADARDDYRSYQRNLELRVFLYRLALTLPLLLIAAFLFIKQRHSNWWPFVWGFIYFAIFVFFVELVPYLPSYGGYVRYGVGVVLTLVIGRVAIINLGRYLERQKEQESLPDIQRRKFLEYEQALSKMAKGFCPSCERAVDFSNEKVDFCPHCGISLFDYCHNCKARKNSFANFCYQCGASAKTV